MTNFLKDHIVCTWARIAGPKQHLTIVEIASPHEYAGAEVMLTLRKSQYWIGELNEGDIVYVKDRLKPGDKIDFMADPLSNSQQPLFDQFGKQQSILNNETFVGSQVVDNSESRDLPGTFRIDTFVSNPEHIAILKKLDTYCSKKEAGHLLLKYAISSLPSAAKQMEALELYDWLNKF